MHRLAQITNPVLPKTIGSGTVDEGVSGFGKIIGGVVGGFFFFCFIIAFIYLLLGAAQWITSGGDKTGLESARNKITHAIVGLIIVGAAWAIFVLVGNWFGIDVTHMPIPTITP